MADQPYKWTFPEDVRINRALIQALLAVLIEKRILTFDELNSHLEERLRALLADEEPSREREKAAV